MQASAEATTTADQAAFVIADWTVDPATLRLSKGRETVKLEPKAMAVLVYLAARQGRVVSRQDLEENVWAGTVVGYDAISNAVIKLRRAFGDDAQNSRIIETIPKAGYRLIAEVTAPADSTGQYPGRPDTPSEVPSATGGNQPASRFPLDGKKLHLSVIVSAILVAIVGLFWVASTERTVEPASTARMAYALPEKPSVVVLPFDNRSDDSQQERYADGITEDLTTELSRIEGLFVVARNTAFTYKRREVEIRTVAEELGVRNVLQGSVQRSGDQVRINVWLIDALSGGQVWAERYSGSVNNVFLLQDQIANDVAPALAKDLGLTYGAEKGKVSEKLVNAEVYDLYLRGWEFYRAGKPQDYVRAVDYYRRALDIDPDFARARAALAAVLSDAHRNRWWQELGYRERVSFEKARLAQKHSAEMPIALTHQVTSEWFAYYDGSARRALAEAKKAIELNPNDPAGHAAMANALLKNKQPAQAEASMLKAMRLDPHYPPRYQFRLGQIQYHRGHYDAALESLENATRRNPDDDWAMLYLAATHGKLQQVEQGRKALEEADVLRARQGWGPITLLALSHPGFYWRGDIKQIKDGLRAIGTPTGGEWYSLIQLSQKGEFEQVQGATTVDAKKAHELFERGLLFVDTHLLWFENRIPSSKLLELWRGEGYRFNENALRQLADFDDEIVIYTSRDESRAPNDVIFAAAIAVSRGFTRIYIFPGGLTEWKSAGYPVERPE